MPQCSSLHAPSQQYIQWLFCLWSTEHHVFEQLWSSEMHVSFKMTSRWRWRKAYCTWAIRVCMNHFTNWLDHLNFITHVFPFLLGLLSWTFYSLIFWGLVLQSLPFGWALSAWPLVCCDVCQWGSFLYRDDRELWWQTAGHKHLLSVYFLLNTQHKNFIHKVVITLLGL